MRSVLAVASAAMIIACGASDTEIVGTLDPVSDASLDWVEVWTVSKPSRAQAAARSCGNQPGHRPAPQCLHQQSTFAFLTL